MNKSFYVTFFCETAFKKILKASSSFIFKGTKRKNLIYSNLKFIDDVKQFAILDHVSTKKNRKFNYTYLNLYKQ